MTCLRYFWLKSVLSPKLKVWPSYSVLKIDDINKGKNSSSCHLICYGKYLSCYITYVSIEITFKSSILVTQFVSTSLVDPLCNGVDYHKL